MANKGLLIFDMDGVLVDVTDSYRAAIQDTVKHFTGVGIAPEPFRTTRMKAAGMTIGCSRITSSVRLAAKPRIRKTVDYFQHIFHEGGLMQRERWIAKPGVLEDLAEAHTLAVFTGRFRWEANLTLDRFAPGLFQQVVGVDDVAIPKPAPDGLLRLVLEIPHETLRYIGDSVDDALSAKAANVPFIRHRRA